MTEQTPVRERVRVRAEHISLEASADESFLQPQKRGIRKVRCDYALHSKLRGCVTKLALLEDHFLAVQLVRPDVEPKKYEFDLRFANAKPVIVRHVAWFWLGLAVSLVALAAAALWMLWPQTAADWIAPVPLTAIAALMASGASVLMFLRRTTESLEFWSVHGQVTLVSVTGAIGSTRGGKKFFVELIKSIGAAKTARPQPAQQFLRDEMREHHRLREIGALSEAQYEASKSRILSSH
ncbi:MAG: hypothetical protein ABW171_05795 [Steroidobacter sp.]